MTIKMKLGDLKKMIKEVKYNAKYSPRDLWWLCDKFMSNNDIRTEEDLKLVPKDFVDDFLSDIGLMLGLWEYEDEEKSEESEEEKL